MTENAELFLQTPHDVLLQMANRVRSLRLEQNMPQGELARRVGVAVGTVKRFEKTGGIQFRNFPMSPDKADADLSL